MTPPIRRTAATLSALALAGTLVLGASHGADAGGLLTGKDIKNSSVTGKDVKDGSLASVDFKAGQLPAGATGPAGPAGPAGKDLQPATVVSWSGTSPANSDPYRVAVSTMTVPAHSVVTGLLLTTTDPSTSCIGGFGAELTTEDDDTALANRFAATSPGSYDQVVVGNQPVKLRIAFTCYTSADPIAFSAVNFTASFAYQTFAAPTVGWSGSTIGSADPS